jgi:hypothetical protein
MTKASVEFACSTAHSPLKILTNEQLNGYLFTFINQINVMYTNHEVMHQVHSGYHGRNRG